MVSADGSIYVASSKRMQIVPMPSTRIFERSPDLMHTFTTTALSPNLGVYVGQTLAEPALTAHSAYLVSMLRFTYSRLTYNSPQTLHRDPAKQQQRHNAQHPSPTDLDAKVKHTFVANRRPPSKKHQAITLSHGMHACMHTYTLSRRLSADGYAIERQ